MKLCDTKLRKFYWHPGRSQMVELITCDPSDGASLIVEPLDACGDIMGGDLFRCEAVELQEATRERWEVNYPATNPDVFTFEEIVGERNLLLKVEKLSRPAEEWLHRIAEQIGEGVDYDPNDILRAECAEAGLLTVGARGYVELAAGLQKLLCRLYYKALEAAQPTN